VAQPTNRSQFRRNLAIAIGLSTIACQSHLFAQNSVSPQSQTFQLPPPANVPGVLPLNGNVEAKLQIYNVPLDNVGEVGALLQTQFGSDKRVRVTTEPNTGRLMVLAPETTQQQIAQVVESVRKRVGSLNMDARGNVVPSTIQQNQYKLRRATWRELEDAVGRLAGPRLTITTLNNGELAQLKLVSKDSAQEIMLVDRRNDEVRLQGTPANVMAWTQVVTAIDIGQSDPSRPTQIVPINPATPERIERAIRLVKMASFQQPNQGDEATGTARLNPQRNPNAQPGDDEKATVIGAPDALAAGSGLIGDVDISFVPEMGLVIVKGSKKDVARVLEVIEQIKKQSVETKPDIDLVLLKHVNSQALGTIIKDLNDNVFALRQGQISITALGQPNGLLLIGRPEALVGIKELIEKLDQPLDPNSQLRVFRFVNSSAVDAETLIKNFFGDSANTNNNQNNAQGNSSGLIARVKAVADYRTNSLIVQASPRDQAEVARLVKEIDVESPASESEIKIFAIKNAIASELQPILQSAITGEPVSTSSQGQGQGQGQGNNNNSSSSSGSSQASSPSSRLSVVPRNGKTIGAGSLTGVTVTTNPSINSLVVRAPSSSMALIASLIEQLDQLPSVDARIKVFEVQNGDATSLASTLQIAFGVQSATTNSNNQGLFGQQNLASLTGGEGSLLPLRISTDTRTNSIIVSGSQSDLEVIEVLLLRLDEQGAKLRSTDVVWLRNSSAVDVANALTNLFNAQRQNITNTLAQQAGANGAQISVFERIDREVFVFAEPATNSLVISATPRYMTQARQVIERLDRQQPMIAVEILIAEVTLDDQFDFGAEFGLQDSLLFDRNSASGGTLSSPAFNNSATAFNSASTQRRPQNVAGQGLSGFGLGRTNTGLGYGGLVLAAGSESVNMLFRALQDANRVQILSRPQLMTLDNNISVVQVGSDVPRITSQGTSQVGLVQNQFVDVPVGLVMQIQPRTNQDGLINMIVAVSRSTLGPVETGIPIGFSQNGDVIRSPIINKTAAQTRVTAYDGQTVVLGGLITKTRSTRSRRIPWLADIPIAGALFRFDSQSENRTELLVVMTPRVINFNDAEKLDMIKQVESSRMSWCLADVLNIHGDAGLSAGNGLWGPASSPVIYPDLQPTVEPSSRSVPPNMMIGEPELMNGAPGVEMSEGYPINAPVQSSPNGTRTLINPSSRPSTGPVESASPIQNSSYQQVRNGMPGNGVAPAAYQPVSPPNARMANGR
jgi:general secretion pathway protein D